MLATLQNNQKITAKLFGSLDYFDRQFRVSCLMFHKLTNNNQII